MEIFHCLSYEDLRKCREVCKTWNKVRKRIIKVDDGTVPSGSSVVSSVDTSKPDTRFGKIGGYFALFGGALLQFTLGSIFCFGNLSPYIASYFTHNDYMNITKYKQDTFDIESTYNNYVSQINWVLFVALAIEVVFILFGGNIEIIIGPPKTLIMSSILMTLGFGLTYFALINHSFLLLMVTYGIIFGIGTGIGYPVSVVVLMKWFPKRKGVVCGFNSAVFGAGVFVFDAIQTKLVNPYNLAMDSSYGYALQQDIIVRIPFMFIYVAAIMLTMNIIAIVCTRNPPWFKSTSEMIETNVSKSQ